MRGRPMKGRVGICARCHRDRRITARNLCGTCYGTEHDAGRLDRWPLMGLGKKQTPPPPPDPNAPAAPQATVCGWCSTPLTRSRQSGGQELYEVFTVAGVLVALCFENCPADRVLELTEVSGD